MSGFFELRTSNDLYQKAKSEYEKFCKNPNDYEIFNLITSLYHLREWICPVKYDSFKHKNKSEYTREELIYSNLHENENYEIIRLLCNNSKHFNDREISERTEISCGFEFGLNQFGDSFGHRNYLVDDKDLRVIIDEVFKIYDKYFEDVRLKAKIW